MKGDEVPDHDHIARLCGGAKLDEEGNVTGACFQLRSNERYLSVNWLELLHADDRSAQLDALRKVLLGKMRVGSTAKLAVHQVGEIREYVRRESPDGRDLSVLHEPANNDASHCGVYGLEPDADLIADLIADIVRETYPAKSS